jgi:hypothetical protein
MPAAAKKHTAAGAEAFVRYWVEVVNFAQATGQTSALEAIDDVRCAGCRGVVKAIRSPYSKGGRIEGGAWQVGSLRELPLDYGADWAAFAKAKTDVQTVYKRDGAGETYPGGAFHFYAYVAYDGGWRMRWLRTPT